MGKLEIEINGLPVELPDDISIPADWYNRIFGLHDLELKTFTFKLYLTENNLPILGHVNRTQSYPYLFPNKIMTVKCEGVVFYEGEFYVNSATDNDVECFFGASFNKVIGTLEDKELNMLNYGGPELLGASLFESLDNLYSRGTDINNEKWYLFPVANRKLQAEKTDNQNLIEGDNLYDWKAHPMAPEGMQNHLWKRPDGTYGILETNRVSIFPKMSAILDAIFNEIGYTIVNNIFKTDDEFSSLCFYSNYLWYNEYYKTPLTSPHYLDLKYFVPDSSAIDFLKNLEVDFNLTFVFNETNKTCTVVINESVFGKVPADDITRFCSTGREITFSDFDGLKFSRKENEDLFTTGTNYNENYDFLYPYLRYDTLPAFRSPSIGLTQYSTPIILNAYRNPNKLFQAKNPDDAKPCYKLSIYDPKTNKPKERQSGFNITSMTKEGTMLIMVPNGIIIGGAEQGDPVELPIRVPSVAISVIDNMVPDDTEQTETGDRASPIMMFYRGMKSVAGAPVSVVYPYGSVDVCDIDGLTQEYEESLMLNDEVTHITATTMYNASKRFGYGHIQKFHSLTAAWYKEGKPRIKVPMEMPVAYLKNIRWHEPYLYKNQSVLIEQVSGDLSKKGLSMCAVTLALL